MTLIGARFGRLVVTREVLHAVGTQGKRRTDCIGQCDCGTVTDLVYPGHLKSGATVSCGCWGHEAARAARTTHGHSVGGKLSPTYLSWSGMLARCTNPKNKAYPRYGGRGITVCERWRSFENFLTDMGERPVGTTIDRAENDEGYRPGNCRWATPLEQRHNQRRC